MEGMSESKSKSEVLSARSHLLAEFRGVTRGFCYTYNNNRR